MSNISLDFPNKSPCKADAASNNSEGEFRGSTKKELLTLKYIQEGGIILKKNLFSQWLKLYENEISFLKNKTPEPESQ